jgi:Effector Associated Constant Component 1
MSEVIKLSVSMVGRTGDDEDGSLTGLEDLSDWLRAESELAGRVHEVHAAPLEGQLGALSDGLEIMLGAVGSGGALSVLAASLKSWFAQPRRSDFRVRIPVGGDRFVEIDAARARAGDVEAILAQALGAANQANQIGQAGHSQVAPRPDRPSATR